MRLYSDALVDTFKGINIDGYDKVEDFLDEQVLKVLRYTPERNIGFSKDEYITKFYSGQNLSLVEKEFLYLSYRMKLDELFDVRTT